MKLICVTLLSLSIATATACMAQDAEVAVISDNSFFIEEAYNQEAGVVQHIFNAIYFTKPVKEGVLSFTEEFPLLGQRHQGSFTIPLEGASGERLRLGEVFFHYRYQLLLDENGNAVSPRISLSITTEDSDERESGSFGYQFNLPVSVRVNSDLVSHFNAGATILPNFGGDGGPTVPSYNLGGSVIWLTTPTFNVMLEIAQIWSGYLGATGDIAHVGETVISPGARMAINRGTLQIVPGVGVPIRFTDGDSNVGIFGYLSLEHPL